MFLRRLARPSTRGLQVVLHPPVAGARAICVTPARLVPSTTHLQSFTPIGTVDAKEADEVLQANAGLLAAISKMDWEEYGTYCADDISCVSSAGLAPGAAAAIPFLRCDR